MSRVRGVDGLGRAVLTVAHHASRAAHGAAGSAAHTTTAPDVSVGHVLLQMGVGLVVVVGGIWGFSKLLGRGRRSGGLAGRRSSGEQLVVLSRQSLGKGLSIAAVRWGDREVLVGIAGTTITFLDGGDAPDQRGEAVPVYGPPLEPPAAARGLPVTELSPPIRDVDRPSRSADWPSKGADWPSRAAGLSGLARAFGRPSAATTGGWRLAQTPFGERGARPTFLQALRDATARR